MPRTGVAQDQYSIAHENLVSPGGEPLPLRGRPPYNHLPGLVLRDNLCCTTRDNQVRTVWQICSCWCEASQLDEGQLTTGQLAHSFASNNDKAPMAPPPSSHRVEDICDEEPSVEVCIETTTNKFSEDPLKDPLRGNLGKNALKVLILMRKQEETSSRMLKSRSVRSGPIDDIPSGPNGYLFNSTF